MNQRKFLVDVAHSAYPSHIVRYCSSIAETAKTIEVLYNGRFVRVLVEIGIGTNIVRVCELSLKKHSHL